MRNTTERNIVTKTWNDLKSPKTIYNHLQPPQKHQQPLANNLKPSKTRHKCLKQGEMRTCHIHEIRESNKTSTSPKILLSLVPCIINHGLSHETSTPLPSYAGRGGIKAFLSLMKLCNIVTTSLLF